MQYIVRIITIIVVIWSNRSSHISTCVYKVVPSLNILLSTSVGPCVCRLCVSGSSQVEQIERVIQEDRASRVCDADRVSALQELRGDIMHHGADTVIYAAES